MSQVSSCSRNTRARPLRTLVAQTKSLNGEPARRASKSTSERSRSRNGIEVERVELIRREQQGPHVDERRCTICHCRRHPRGRERVGQRAHALPEPPQVSPCRIGCSPFAVRPLRHPSASTTAFIAPALAPVSPSNSRPPASSKASSTPHVNAPCEPPPCNARLTVGAADRRFDASARADRAITARRRAARATRSIRQLRSDLVRRQRIAHDQFHLRSQSSPQSRFDRPRECCAPIAREERSPESAQRHRIHRHRDALDDLLHALLEGAEFTVERDLAFREDAYQIAVGQRRVDALIGTFEHLRVLACRCNGNRLGSLEEPVHQRDLEDAMVHHETDRARARAHDQDGIDEADVIARQHRRAFGRDAVRIDRAHTVERMRQDPREEAQQEFRHKAVDVERHGRIHQGCNQEELRDGEPGREQRRGRQ